MQEGGGFLPRSGAAWEQIGQKFDDLCASFNPSHTYSLVPQTVSTLMLQCSQLENRQRTYAGLRISDCRQSDNNLALAALQETPQHSRAAKESGIRLLGRQTRS